MSGEDSKEKDIGEIKGVGLEGSYKRGEESPILIVDDVEIIKAIEDGGLGESVGFRAQDAGGGGNGSCANSSRLV